MSALSDEQVILAAARLVQEGRSVTLRVYGRSMLPFIVGGLDSVVLARTGMLRKGDIVLARTDEGIYVLHRILHLAPERVVLMGDGNLRKREVCRPEDVLARAVARIGADGRRRQLDTAGQRLAACLWRWLLPLRRGLLYLYRNLFLRNTPIR